MMQLRTVDIYCSCNYVDRSYSVCRCSHFR